MIASENNSGGVITHARRDCFDKPTEVCGGHAGVTTILIDLITGRLNEDTPSVAKPQSEGRLYDNQMGCAD
jgi:hypothetical protein